MGPIKKFQEWYNAQLQVSADIIPTSCCLSTIGTDGYPNARFVSLKEIKHDTFIITGPVISRKGIEITAIPKAALTFWWAATKKQIRIQGDAVSINNDEADRYFRERDRESCIISRASNQGQILEDANELDQSYQRIEHEFKNTNIPRPENWGGFSITPVRIEFLEFRENRFHDRTLYTRNGSGWKMYRLQP